jgi:MFS family permease
MMLVLRAAEGFGFLLVVLPGPALLRRLVAARRVNSMIGLWGAYMPLGAALGLLAGPVWIEHLGWRCLRPWQASSRGPFPHRLARTRPAASPAGRRACERRCLGPDRGWWR